MDTSKPILAGRQAVGEFAELFATTGWRVQREPEGGRLRVDLVLSKAENVYVAEVKVIAEGRPDRVIALLSQAILQSQAYAREFPAAKPLALIWIGRTSAALMKKIESFHRQFAPDVAIGVISGDGVRYFVGSELEALSNDILPIRKELLGHHTPVSNLFSDLNQWMLKVLLAPEIPDRFLTAPRSKYRNITELAGASSVSAMSASRFVKQLRQEGFLNESGQYLQLVRRTELFRRWQSAATRSSPEVRMRFIIPGTMEVQLRKLVSRHHACLGLFAAADALGLGYVTGVPPYVYVPRMSPSGLNWRGSTPTNVGEQPHFIVKQTLTPQSLFRGAVMDEGVRIADVLQVWLDVSPHPSRGEEQAELLQRKVLQNVIGQAA